MKRAKLSALAAAIKTGATLQGLALARRLASLVLLASTVILCGMPKPALGNVFVADLGPFGVDDRGTIGEYTNSGATVNASLISGLSFPGSIAVSEGFIYVTNFHEGTIGKYTTSGLTINPTLISGLNAPGDIEVSGGDLYVAELNRVGKYSTSGGTVNASLITGLSSPPGALAVSGTNLFVGTGSTLGEYTTSGGTIDASLVTDLQNVTDVDVSGSSLFILHAFVEDSVVGKYNVDGTAIAPHLISSTGVPTGLAISGTDLFLLDNVNGVGKYTTSGMLVANPLITGLTNSFGIAVDDSSTVPETLSSLWFGLTTAGLLGFAALLRNKYSLQLSR